MTDPDEQVIRFTVKELFLDVKADLKKIDEKLDHKADQIEVTRLTERIIALETDTARKEAVEQHKRWQMIIGGIAGLSLLGQAAQSMGLIK